MPIDSGTCLSELPRNGFSVVARQEKIMDLTAEVLGRFLTTCSRMLKGNQRIIVGRASDIQTCPTRALTGHSEVPAQIGVGHAQRSQTPAFLAVDAVRCGHQQHPAGLTTSGALITTVPRRPRPQRRQRKTTERPEARAKGS